MNKSIIFIFVLILQIFIFCLDYGLAQPYPLWTNTSAGTIALSLTIDNDGNILVGGLPLITKLDSSGNLLYASTIYTDAGRGIKVDESGNIYVVGNYLRKFNSNNLLLWTTSYGGDDLVLDSSNNIYVAGLSNGSFPFDKYDASIYKHNNDGLLLWTTNYESTSLINSHFYDIDIDANGDIIAVGSISDRLLIAKYSQSGYLIWSDTTTQGYAGGITKDKFNNIYIAGTKQVSSNKSDIYIQKYDTSMNLIWSILYDPPGNYYRSRARKITVDVEENIYIIGSVDKSSNTYDYNRDIIICKFDKNRNMVWSEIYDSPNSGFDWESGIVLDQSDNIYVVGQIGAANVTQDGYFWVRKYGDTTTANPVRSLLDKVKVFPNPYKANSEAPLIYGIFETDKGIVFSEITPPIQVKIYTIAGELVYSDTIDNNKGYFVWRCVDNYGVKVASGIYIYIITNSRGEKKTGKLAVIR